MNALGISLMWCMVQVSLAAGLGGLFYLTVRRIVPSTGSTAALGTMLTVLMISAMAFSPWPQWNWEAIWSSQTPTASEVAVEANDFTSNNNSSADSSATDAISSSVASPGTGDIASAAEDQRSLANVMQRWQAWMGRHSHTVNPTSSPTSSTWLNFVAIAFLVGALMGFIRLLTGLRFVKSYRLDGQILQDADLLETVNLLRAELRAPRPIEVRQSPRVSAAATVGWRRPVILLPSEWTEWTAQQRRAVLAHEIAHITRGDFLSWFWAQLGVVLHFYHPLVHWLAGRLRLEQELAADALAAHVSGGHRLYLQTLAEMALRQPERRLSWPARAFLPTHRTLFRRIEMLRNLQPGITRTNALVRLVTFACLVCIGLVAAGFRGNASVADQVPIGPMASPEENLLAQAPQIQPEGSKNGDKPASDKIELSYVPFDSVGVAVIRPAAIFRQPEFSELKTGVARLPELHRLSQMEQITLVFLSPPGNPKSLGDYLLSAVSIATGNQEDIHQWTETLLAESVPMEANGVSYFRSSAGVYFANPIRQTILFSQTEASLQRLLLSGPAVTSHLVSSLAWGEAESSHAALTVDGKWMRRLQSLVPPGGFQAPLFAMLTPLWEESKMLTASASVLGEQFQTKLTVESLGIPSAERIHATLEALLTLQRNAAQQRRIVGARADLARMTSNESLLAAYDRLIDNANLNQDGLHVILTSQAIAAPRLLSSLYYDANHAREDAQRSQSRNNFKMIGLALHNYNDTFGHFPPAVLTGPDGKTKHSWRVAILPFVDAGALYDNYHMNEPWDSPHNRTILARMPVAFRDPHLPPESTNTSYFALVGPRTAFGKPDGVKREEFTDGLSNTWLVIEAKRDIPWSKPEDIPYDPEKPLPKLGGITKGNFHVLFADGRVQLLPDTLEEQVVRLLITINDGNPIPAGTLDGK